GADAEEAEVQQTHRARQHAVAVEVRPGQPLGALAPDCGESAGELEHVVELLAVAPLPPGRVVQVLPAPGGVGAHGLQMAVLVGADPYVGPRRRDGQRPDAGDRLSFGNARPVAVQIHEPSAGLAARETRVVAGHTAQTGHGQTFARSHTRQNAPRNAPGAQEPQPKAGAPRFWQGVLAKTTPCRNFELANYLLFSAASWRTSLALALPSWALASARASVASRCALPFSSWA